MDKTRYILMDREGGPLTQEEADAGWHFCSEWDGMLIGPGMQEYESCCIHRERRERKSKRKWWRLWLC